uniref:Plastid-encoded RNA polymerase subunit alpha n=1 Tax=Eutreptia viridis TaxID=96908 RepID=H8ZXG7_9EUGL|nr:photosystem I 5 kDa protein [Eutreptia viridis]
MYINNHFKNYENFTLGPLKQNAGITFGNMLRRVLLNSIESIGIIDIKYSAKNQDIDKLNIKTEFQELILEFSENIKKLIFIIEENKNNIETKTVILEIEKIKRFTAKDLKTPSEIKIVNSNQYLGTNTIFEGIEIQIGIGYFKDLKKKEKYEKNNHILLGRNNFNPIERVNYKIKKIISSDKLEEQVLLEIWTNGSITPKKALIQALNICGDTLQEIKQKLLK